MAAHSLSFRSILCPTDFAGESRAAFSHAVALCGATGADLTLAHVHPRELPMAAEFSYLSPAPLDALERAELSARLEGLAAAARARGVLTHSRLLEGEPSCEVAELAREIEADLMVVGFHPEARLRRFLMGSTAEELMRHAPCPVVTVRHDAAQAPEEVAPIRRVLCAADLRPSGSEVVPYAIALAASLGAKLTLLHVLEQVPAFEPGSAVFSAVETQVFRQAMAEDARQRLHAAVSDADPESRAVREIVCVGSAHERILEAAREERSQLIVLGPRAPSPLERMLFGSTSRRVVRDAPCPVLVVRGAAAALAARPKQAASEQTVHA
jgi:nucleotide-binding universal stress UspA family protein